MNKFPIRLDYYQYCVETWQEIFKRMDMSAINTVVDFCPGWAPKIELALINSTFSGTIYAVDEIASHLNMLEHLLKPFKRSFLLHCVSTNILDQKKWIDIPQADLMIGNHMFDDILLSQFCHRKHTSYESVFSDKEQSDEVWRYFLSHEEELHDVSKTFVKLVHNKLHEGGFLLFSQYLSYPDRLKKNMASQTVVNECIRYLNKLLTDIYNYQNLSSEIFPGYMKNVYFKQEEFFAYQKAPLS